MTAADPPAEPLPLDGFTVGVTAARRREELVSLLERRGARVVEAPALRIIPTGDDEELQRVTRVVVDEPLDIAVATTGIGFRGWMEAAEGWGLGDGLRSRLAGAELLARGPKARGAVRAAGLAEAWSPDSEASEEVLARLLAQDLEGRRVAVQLHGEPLPGFIGALRDAGAVVLEVPVYRWVPPEDIRPVQRLVEAVLAGSVDCVTFTSAPAVASLLATAREAGVEDGLVGALRGRVIAACVGPVTAAGLVARGVPVVQPERMRLGALVRTVVDELPARRVRRVVAGPCSLELRGGRVVVDGRPVDLPVRQAAVLAALADEPGRVLSRPELLARAWPCVPGTEAADEHAVEMVVARLRASLGPAGGVVETVVKRGYRLAEPAASHALAGGVRTS